MDGRHVHLHLVRPDGVYRVPLYLAEDISAGLDWIRQPGARHLARPYWQAVVEYADEKLDRAIAERDSG